MPWWARPARCWGPWCSAWCRGFSRATSARRSSQSASSSSSASYCWAGLPPAAQLRERARRLPARLVDDDGRQHQDEQDETDDSDQAAARRKRRQVVEGRRVVEPDEERDQARPYEPVQRRSQRGERIAATGAEVPQERARAEEEQRRDRRLADGAVVPAKERVGDPAAVELAHREQVQRRDEKAGPRGIGHRVREEHVARRDRSKAQIREDPRERRVAERGVAARRRGNDARPRQAQEDRRERDRQSRQRAGGGDVEE